MTHKEVSANEERRYRCMIGASIATALAWVILTVVVIAGVGTFRGDVGPALIRLVEVPFYTSSLALPPLSVLTVVLARYPKSESRLCSARLFGITSLMLSLL